MGIHPRHYDNKTGQHSREVMARVLRDAAQFVHLSCAEIDAGLDWIAGGCVRMNSNPFTSIPTKMAWGRSLCMHGWGDAFVYGLATCNAFGERFGVTCALCWASGSTLKECGSIAAFAGFITPRQMCWDWGSCPPVDRPGPSSKGKPYALCGACAAVAQAYIGPDCHRPHKAQLEGALAAALVSRGFKKRVRDNASRALQSNPRQPLDAYMAREWAAA